MSFKTEVTTYTYSSITNSEDDFSEVEIGTIIHIKSVGYYMLCNVSGGQVALISLVGGNRWDEPINVKTKTKYTTNFIREMVGGGFSFEVVKTANFYFSKIS